MKNYQNSDYALNRRSDEIVYRSGDKLLVITSEAYIAENPDKTKADFQKLKVLSDDIYFEQDRKNYRQTRENIPLSGFAEAIVCTDPSPDALVERSEQEISKQSQLRLAKMAINTLTAVQRRRYILYIAIGLTTREIAKKEGVGQRSIMDSIQLAEKKINKFLQTVKNDLSKP